MNAQGSTRAIAIDFQNADADGFVRLNTVGAISTIASQGLVLSDGIEVTVTDGEIELHGVIRKPGSEGLWRVQVDMEEVFRLHAARRDDDGS